MKKEIYELTELEIIKFYTEDVLTASAGGLEDEDELPFVPKKKN